MKFIAFPACIIASVLILLSLASAPVAAMQRTPGTAAAQGAAAGNGGYHALVVGNNNYASLSKLKTAESDARHVAALLKEYYGFETAILLNATRAQIISALAGYRSRLGPEARFLVYYAGHGYNDRDKDKAYWLPVDAARDDPGNWIIVDDITSAIKVIPARQVLVVSDSCYSGTLTRGIRDSLPPPNERERFIDRMASGHARMLMASGGSEPVADSGGSGHSVFAAALLRGLREMSSRRFTAAELFRNYVLEQVAGRAEQTPEYNPIRNSGHESGDFVFVKVKASDTPVAGTASTPAMPAPAGAPFDPAALDFSFWESIKTSTDPEDHKAYLERFPSGIYAALARRRAYPAPAVVPSPAGTAVTRVRDLIERANKAITERNYDEAIRLTTDGIRLDPQYVPNYLSRAAAYIKKGDYDATIRDATEAIRLDSQDATAYNTRAAAHIKKGDYDAAIRDTTEALKINPRYAVAYNTRAAAHNSKRDYDAAIRDTTAALRIDPQYAVLYNTRAVAYNSKGDYDAAIRDATKAIGLDPRSATAYNNRAYAHNSKGNYDAGIRDATEAIRLDPQDAVAYNTRAYAHNSKGDYDAAIRDTTGALRVDPQYAVAYSTRAYAQNFKGNYDAAIRDATEAIRLDPQYDAAYSCRAFAYEKLGIKDRAQADRIKEAELKAKR